MRRRVWLWLGMTLTGCSGGYSLAPTPCDDLCNATQGGLLCSDYDPAQCVVQCESQGLSSAACLPALKAVVRCFRANPDAATAHCSYDAYWESECRGVSELLLACSGAPFE